MKKGWKIALLCGVAAVPVGLIIGLSIPNNSIKNISTVGSTDLKPFIEPLAEEYSKQHNEYDITVEAGGSDFGIQETAYGYANIGNATKNPFSKVKSSFKQEWIDRRMKTVTLGWEGICIVYIPPEGISNDAKSKLNSILDMNNTNIGNIYRTFSGYQDGLGQSKPTMGLFLNNTSLSQNDQKLFRNQEVIPFARSGGYVTSGTTASFYNDSHLDFNPNSWDEKQQNAFKFGNYGNDWKVYDTDEANTRAWDSFNRYALPGSMVYLSSGFVKQNEKLIKDYGYGVFSYEGTEFKVDDINKTSGYNFYHPLNMTLSIGDEKSIDFINFLINDSWSSKWNEMGARQVNNDEKNTMSNGGTMWITDEEISELRYGSDFWENPTSGPVIFGAKDFHA